MGGPWGWSRLKVNAGLFPQGGPDSKPERGDGALTRDYVSWDVKSLITGEHVF